MARRATLLVLSTISAACVNLDVEGPSVQLWETVLQAELDYPDVTGQAAAVSGPSGTETGVEIQGAEPDAVHAWGVRLGSCATPGAQIGPDTEYPDLEVSAGGNASAATRFGSTLSTANAYHVEVRVSASDRSRVACGDLMPR
jgi:hypothetical protein